MTNDEKKLPFERVYTMNFYWDAPRRGIANFHGKPHLYVSPFDDSKDDYVDWYELRLVDDETLSLELEAWAIWIRWDDAFKAGVADIKTHPALPTERARYDEIKALLDARFEALPGPAVRARGRFRHVQGHENASSSRWLEVHWTDIE